MALLGLAACSNAPMLESPQFVVRTEDTPEAEARAAFVQVASVSQRQDVDAFRQLIYPADLPDMDAEERQQAGHYAAVMASIATHKPKDFRLDLNGSTATFTTDPDLKPDARTVVVLVRDGALWKIAIPKNEDSSSLSPAPEAVSEQAARKTRTRKPMHKRGKPGGAKGRRITKQAIVTISAHRREGIRNAPDGATAAAIRAVVEWGAGGFRQEARPRGTSLGAGGSQKVLNEAMMESVLDPDHVRRAYEQVKRNGGAAGEWTG